MELRGPGDLMGTRNPACRPQMADLLRDRELLTTARYIGTRILEEDARLESPSYAILKAALIRAQQGRTGGPNL